MTSLPTLHFVTLFPETIRIWLETSIIGRAYRNHIFEFYTYNLRDFAEGKYRAVDDVPYGGGTGMILCVEPLVKAVEAIREKYPSKRSKVIFFSPAGEKMSQGLLDNMEKEFLTSHLILICGHYEGVDQRFIENFVDYEVSLGDFVLTGGEIPALAFSDALIRKLSGVLATEKSVTEESFAITDPESGDSLIEYPHYTRPAEYRGLKVPDILLSGHHENIAEWRLSKARSRTSQKELLNVGETTGAP